MRSDIYVGSDFHTVESEAEEKISVTWKYKLPALIRTRLLWTMEDNWKINSRAKSWNAIYGNDPNKQDSRTRSLVKILWCKDRQTRQFSDKRTGGSTNEITVGDTAVWKIWWIRIWSNGRDKGKNLIFDLNLEFWKEISRSFFCNCRTLSLTIPQFLLSHPIRYPHLNALPFSLS